MKRSKRIAACLALMFACSAVSLRAEDPKPVVFARASISSIDDIKKVIADLGIPLPMDPKGMIEMQLPFIGPDGVQSDKPLGTVAIAGENIPQTDASIAAIPVAAGKADIAALTQANGQPVTGHADMVAIAGKNFRRTTNYLLMCPGAADILATIPDNIFAQDYTKQGRFAMVSVDIAAARAAAPTKYKAFLDQVSNQPMPAANPAQAAEQKMGQDAVRNFIDKTDYIEFALGREQNALHIASSFRPTQFTGARTFPQPAFPAGVVAQMNMAYPDAHSADCLANFVDALPDSGFVDAHTDAAHAPHAKALAVKLAKLLEGDAQSLAVDFKGGKPVVYLVNQYTTDRDLSKEIPAVLEEALAFNKDVHDDSTATQTTYQSESGKTISRIVLTDADKTKPPAYLDYIQNGRIATFSFASDNGKYLDAVASLPAKGQMSDLCSGSVDLAACLQASQTTGKAPMPPAVLKEMTTAFAGQSITWTAKVGAAKNLDLDLAIPFPVLQEATKMIMMQFMGAPPPQPAQPPAPVG